jgi:hypothetical protein
MEAVETPACISGSCATSATSTREREQQPAEIDRRLLARGRSVRPPGQEALQLACRKSIKLPVKVLAPSSTSKPTRAGAEAKSRPT